MRNLLLKFCQFTNGLNFFSPIADLLIRLWVANVFWKAGMVKILSFDSTLWLFANEYHVPVLSPTLAAYLGTAVELSFPILLALGLAGRFTACVLFIYNIIAVISYPAIGDGINDHIMWGLMLLVTLTHGPGKLSLDYFICKKFLKQ